MSEEKTVDMVERDISYFDKMVAGAEKIVRPWKIAVIWLIIAFMLSNLVWGGVHAYHLKKAYEDTMEFEQSQDFPAQSQEQTAKGVS
jgi:hypothetical protein